jgi:hypothetical protein
MKGAEDSMSELFRVAIHYENDNGYIEYDVASKQIKVVLDNAKRQEVEDYLGKQHIISNANLTVHDFTDQPIVPAESLDNLKLALSRMWKNIDVLVDWSRPVA